MHRAIGVRLPRQRLQRRLAHVLAPAASRPRRLLRSRREPTSAAASAMAALLLAGHVRGWLLRVVRRRVDAGVVERLLRDPRCCSSTCCHSSRDVARSLLLRARGRSGGPRAARPAALGRERSLSSTWCSLTASQYSSRSSARPSLSRRRRGQQQDRERSRVIREPGEVVVGPPYGVTQGAGGRARGAAAPREELARTARRRGAEDPPDVGGRAALRAVPRGEERAVDVEASPVSPMVAPTTAPNEPSGSAPALRLAQAGRAPPPATVRPSVARWRAGPRGPPCWR